MMQAVDSEDDCEDVVCLWGFVDWLYSNMEIAPRVRVRAMKVARRASFLFIC
jgi:hypothetical protein